MIGAIIGAATSIAGSIAGGIASKKAAKKAQKQLDEQNRKNEEWYNRRYNEDATQTAEARNMLRQAREAAAERIRQARGTQAVMGNSGENVAQAYASANDMLGDTMSNIAAQGTARKDAIESQYMSRNQAIADQYMGMYNQQAANAAQAGSSAMQAGVGLVEMDMQTHLNTGKGMFSNMFKKKQYGGTR